ncbi:hypothetical protein VTJ83DRAFT_5179 [Remersonia thermophila]|uniref:D-isomer specific 2-hydroxyacid dehydrogenase NAD-binding domain-containing protein n=1 Tax=Remersonia thermophila TaxID=72144 RepID=A0ABR4DEA0_9PEZI
MVLIKTSPTSRTPNPTLKGHKLLLTLPRSPTPTGFAEALKAKFPDLEVDVHYHEGIMTAPVLADETWKDVTILVTFRAFPEKVELAPKLEYVQLMSAGANHVLENEVFREGDAVWCTANGVHGPQISEWIISTYLAFEHRIPQYLDLQKQARWDRGDMHSIEDSADKTVGILGYGSIGRQTARLAAALGMKIHAYTLHPRDTPESRRDRAWAPPGLGDPQGVLPSRWFSGGSKEDLHAFLSSGLDLLVVATPLTGQTQHLLGREELEVLHRASFPDAGKEGDQPQQQQQQNDGTSADDGAPASRRGRTFVSNIARGPVIDTDALMAALREGRIRGAALDVTDPEPLPDGHPLWSAPNVLITPHVSGASTRYAERVLAILLENLGRLAEGKPLVNRIDKKRGY